MTPRALPLLAKVLAMTELPAGARLKMISRMDEVFGLRFLEISRADLRLHPRESALSAEEIEHKLALRQKARAEKNFSEADAIRAELVAKGIEIMDGDPLAWEWRLKI